MCCCHPVMFYICKRITFCYVVKLYPLLQVLHNMRASKAEGNVRGPHVLQVLEKPELCAYVYRVIHQVVRWKLILRLMLETRMAECNPCSDIMWNLV